MDTVGEFSDRPGPTAGQLGTHKPEHHRDIEFANSIPGETRLRSLVSRGNRSRHYSTYAFIPWFDRNGHPFVPTCLRAGRHARRFTTWCASPFRTAAGFRHRRTKPFPVSGLTAPAVAGTRPWKIGCPLGPAHGYSRGMQIAGHESGVLAGTKKRRCPHSGDPHSVERRKKVWALAREILNDRDAVMTFVNDPWFPQPVLRRSPHRHRNLPQAYHEHLVLCRRPDRHRARRPTGVSMPTGNSSRVMLGE